MEFLPLCSPSPICETAPGCRIDAAPTMRGKVKVFNPARGAVAQPGLPVATAALLKQPAHCNTSQQYPPHTALVLRDGFRAIPTISWRNQSNPVFGPHPESVHWFSRPIPVADCACSGKWCGHPSPIAAPFPACSCSGQAHESHPFLLIETISMNHTVLGLGIVQFDVERFRFSRGSP